MAVFSCLCYLASAAGASQPLTFVIRVEAMQLRTTKNNHNLHHIFQCSDYLNIYEKSRKLS